MIESLRVAFTLPDLRRRILFTIAHVGCLSSGGKHSGSRRQSRGLAFVYRPGERQCSGRFPGSSYPEVLCATSP